MKKQFGILALVAVMFASCTNDDSQNTDTTASIEKTSVIANIATPTSSTTAKTVNRGSIFAWVKDINVTATSTAWSYSTSTLFDLVASGGESSFKIDNVALGANVFNATTTTNTLPVAAFSAPTSSTTASDLKTALTQHNPYAIYAGQTTATISSTALNTVGLNMTTTNGRVISVFEFDDDVQLRANTQATISANVSGDAVYTSDFFSGAQVISFEWSNANATVGKTVTYTINVYDKANPAKLIVSYPIIPVTIKASTSISCTYQINRDKVINDNPETLTFTWQQWVEQSCETTYDNEGYNCLGFDVHGRDKDGRNRQGFNKCGWHKAPNAFYLATQDEDLTNGGLNECGN